MGEGEWRLKAVITGATGFIGTALCEEMLKNGHEVTAVIRPGSEKRKKLCFSAALNTHLEVVEAALEDFTGLANQWKGRYILSSCLEWFFRSGAGGLCYLADQHQVYGRCSRGGSKMRMQKVCGSHIKYCNASDVVGTKQNCRKFQ